VYAMGYVFMKACTHAQRTPNLTYVTYSAFCSPRYQACIEFNTLLNKFRNSCGNLPLLNPMYAHILMKSIDKPRHRVISRFEPEALVVLCISLNWTSASTSLASSSGLPTSSLPSFVQYRAQPTFAT